MSDAPGQQIDDFNELYPRQVAHHTFRVLSLAGDSPTSYLVNIDEGTCTCPDEEFRRDGQEACKHLAMALFQAPKRVRVEEELVNDLSLVLAKLEGAAQDFTSQAGETTTMTADEAMETGPEETETATEEADEVDLTHAADRLEGWLNTAVPAPEHVEMWIGDHGDRTGIVVEPDNGEMTDHAYEAFKGVVNTLEDSEVHVGFGDDPCQTCGEQDGDFWYWVPGETAAEVGGS
jgi:hypothetical protein